MVAGFADFEAPASSGEGHKVTEPETVARIVKAMEALDVALMREALKALKRLADNWTR